MKKHLDHKKPIAALRKLPAGLLFYCALASTSSLLAGGGAPPVVDESECLIEYDGSVLSDDVSDVTLAAQGGTAVNNSGISPVADASAKAIAVNGDILAVDLDTPANLSSTFDLTATGGSASASNGMGNTANADAYVSGVQRVNGDFTGSITGVATGGQATIMGGFSGNSDASASAHGLSSLSGDASGDVDVAATGGTATAGSGLMVMVGPDEIEAEGGSLYSASADASASSVALGYAELRESIGDIDGDGVTLFADEQLIDGSFTATSTGGTSSATGASNAYADSSAEAAAIRLKSFFGEIDAEIGATATGGTANASVSMGSSPIADASADAAGIEGASYIEANVGGTIAAEATGGSATARNSFGSSLADASASASGIEFSSFNKMTTLDEVEAINAIPIGGAALFGDLTADITATAQGGTAVVTNGGLIALPGDEIEGNEASEYGADASAYAAGVEGASNIDGDVSGSITVSATGGDAYAESGFNMYATAVDEVESNDVGSADASADASAEAVGIAAPEAGSIYDMGFDEIESFVVNFGGELDVYGEVSSDISVTAEGGDARAILFGEGSAEAVANAVATGIDGDVDAYGLSKPADAIEGEEEPRDPAPALTGSFTLSAVGGRAYVNNAFSNFLFNDEIEGNGFISEPFLYANASADAFAVDGNVYGDVSATFDINSEGGLAYVRVNDNGPTVPVEALAFAESSGISGELEGDFTGEMTVNATGGMAAVEYVESFFNTQDLVEGDEPSSESLFVDASAIATGIGGDSSLAIDGDVTGPITVTATGGTAAILYEGDGFIPVPDNEIESDSFGVPEKAANAYAQAIAIKGNTYSDEISGALTATAVAGRVIVDFDADVEIFPSEGSDSSADALAAGIAGEYIHVGDISGGITATATAGTGGIAFNLEPDLIEGDDSGDFPTPEIPETLKSFVTNAFAFGVLSTHSQEVCDHVEGDDAGYGVDITISSAVHAIVLQPKGFNAPRDDIESGELKGYRNLYAAAVYGGTDNDRVILAEGADILGDINLNGGSNILSVTGDTIMLGDILSSSDERVERALDLYNGFGTVDFDILSGLFTAVGTVNVSDLLDAIEINEGGGLAPIISRMEGGTSVLNVFGGPSDVNFNEGSIVRPMFNGEEDWSEFGEEERFLIVSSEGVIDAENAIADSSTSPFEIALLKEDGSFALTDETEGSPTGENLFVILGDVKNPRGGDTPGVTQTTQAVNASSFAVMIDISKRAAILRSLLRGTVAANGELPEGAAAPDAERMENGEWLSYISAFGNIGKQETDNGNVGFDYDTYGFVLGLEKLVDDQLILGIAGAYADTDVDSLSNSGGGETDLYSIIAYANWFSSTWYYEGGLTYGRADTETRRTDVANVTYTGDYDSNLYGTWIEAGYSTTYEGLEAEPYARASYVRAEHDGFTDSGAGPNTLKASDSETDSFRTELGLRLTQEWVFEDDSKFLLGVKAAWAHEWADQNVRLDAKYLGAQLKLRSPDADRAALVLGLRGEWRNDDGLAISLQYEPSIAGNWYNHSFSGTVQLNW